nr:ABC transporter transmembrane domain-containing protein [Escherichia coli]
MAGYVAAGFKVDSIATIGQQGIQLIQKTVMIINLWLGAHLVISGDLSIGQLIAFNMACWSDCCTGYSPCTNLAGFPAGWYISYPPW